MQLHFTKSRVQTRGRQNDHRPTNESVPNHTAKFASEGLKKKRKVSRHETSYDRLSAWIYQTPYGADLISTKLLPLCVERNLHTGAANYYHRLSPFHNGLCFALTAMNVDSAHFCHIFSQPPRDFNIPSFRTAAQDITRPGFLKSFQLLGAIFPLPIAFLHRELSSTSFAWKHC